MNVKQLNLRAKIMISVLGPLLIAVIIGMVGIVNIRTIVDSNLWVSHTYQVIGDARNLKSHAIDMETGMRGYLLAGKEAFLGPYEAGETAAFGELKGLRQTVSDNPGQVMKLDEIKSVLKEWQKNITRPYIDLRRKIGDAKTMNDLAKVVEKGEDKTLFDTFIAKIDRFIEIETGLLAKRSSELTKGRKSGTMDLEETYSHLDWVSHTHEVIQEAAALQLSAFDMQRGMRGYLLSGLETYLAPYHEGKNRFSQQVAGLKKMVADNPPQVALLGEIQSMLGQWEKIGASPLIELRKEISHANTMDDMAATIGQAKGKTYFDEFRELLKEFEAEEARLLDTRKQADAATVKQTITLIISCIAVSLVLGIFYAMFIAKDILGQVGGEPSTIAAIARDVAEGRLDIAEPEGKKTGIFAALVEMVRVINQMAAHVENMVGDVASGRLIATSKETPFKGKWQTLLNGINNILESLSGHLDQIPLPFIIIDNDFSILYLNRTAREWAGRSQAQLIGAKCYEHFANANCRTENCTCALAMGSGLKQSVEAQLSSSGRQLVYNASPVADLNGRTSGARMVYVDQTQIKKEDWVKTGLNQLSREMGGEQDIMALSGSILNFLADYVQSRVGVFFLTSEDEELRLVASYAYKERTANYNLFQSGEGLVGQVALERKSIYFSDIPEDHVPMDIISGLGESSPSHIYVFPLIFEEVLQGVIALGFTHDLDAYKREFLDAGAAGIGVSLNMAESRSRLKELLEETQAQAEELQSQQEELEQSNEELEQQTNELKASEEELQSQQEELKVANEELMEKTDLLEEQKKRIEDANVDLEQSQTAMESKARQLGLATKYKTEFLANMSHELRTPLNSMLLLSKNLSRNKTHNLSDKQVNDARIIHDSGNDLLELINGILDLSKIESGKKTVRPEKVYYQDIVDTIKNMFTQMIKEKELEFGISIDEALSESLITDRQKLDQIIKNFMSNAIKFTDTGSIKIRFFAPGADQSLEMSKLAPEKAVGVSISDTGKGIPGEKHQEIFEAFQQADGTIVRKYGGTGLGLTICRELSRLLGGEIQVRSKEQEGSVFTLFLARDLGAHLAENGKPAHAKAVEQGDDVWLAGSGESLPQEEPAWELPASIGDDRQEIKTGDKTILIIEDDVKFARILYDFCHDKGFKCIHVPDGETGLDLVVKSDISAILLDIKLPGINGWGVLKKLKADPRTRHIPVHIMSVEEKPDNIGQKGVIGYLNKPVTHSDLNGVFFQISSILSQGRKTLLTVGDFSAVLETLCQVFRPLGVKIDSVKKGKTALKRLNEKAYDCMILDLELPDMTGFDFLKSLDEQDKKPFVIIHTGMELAEDQYFELNKYASAMISKGEMSTDRLIDEIALFLHSVVEKLPGRIKERICELNDDAADLKGKKILIADDDVRNIYSVITALDGYEMEFIKAANGKKAIEELKKNPEVDLVLMDIMMPEMDGYEAIRLIRKMDGYEKLPIIALTAKSMIKDRQLSFEAGATDYLMKPVDSDKLLSTMRVWLHE